MDQLSPDSQEKRRKRQRRYDAASYSRKSAAAQHDEADLVELPAEPYAVTKTGKARQGGSHARHNAKTRVMANIDAAVATAGGPAARAQALKDYAEMHQDISRPAGYFPQEEVAAALYSQQQLRTMLQRASSSGKAHARATDELRSFVEANLVGIAASPSKGGVPIPSLNARARAIASDGLSVRNAKRLLVLAGSKRAKLTEHEESLSWACVKARKGYSRITAEVRAQLHEWVLNHPRVVASPIANDTILVLNRATGKKERVGKLLREVSVRELHNDLIEKSIEAGGKGGGLECARDANSGNVLISDTALRYLLPEQLKPMTERHKQMCGCELCLTPDSLQRTVNAFRARLKHKLQSEASAMPGRTAKQAADKARAVAAAQAYQPSLSMSPPVPWHMKPGIALGEIQCQPCEGGNGLPHWGCVLRRCTSCPSYPIPPEETGADLDAPRIRFHVYTTVTECTRHGILSPGSKTCAHCISDATPVGPDAHSSVGCRSDAAQPTKPTKPAKVRSRKKLTQMECAIGTFHAEHYLPALEKLAYHRPHCQILGKHHCGGARRAAFRSRPSVRTRRDYAERLAAAFNLEAQHEHFGNSRSLSIEGSSVETFCAAAVEAYQAGVWSMDESALRMVFHSHFSDASRQDAATTHAHMTVLFEHLKEVGELCAGLTVWDDTDGCGKQYRCGTAIYLLSVLACTYGITIDRAIGAPGHGKDFVDGLNATDKVYLRKMMCMTGTPEANDGEKRMAAHAMLGGKAMSLATECQRLCSLPERFAGVKSDGGKYAKREAAARVKERHYHVQDPAKVKYTKLNMVAVGFDAGEHNGILGHYSIQVSKDLGKGKAAMRRIPCACPACLKQLEEPWKPGVPAEKQPRYASSVDCVYWPNFKQADGEPGLNDWKVVTLVHKKDSDAAADEDINVEILAGIETRMAELIEPGHHGAFSTLDEDADGYYVVKWSSAPYTLQADVELTMYTPAIKIKAGELVVDAEYYNKVEGARLWYTPTQGEGRKTTVRVQQVLAANLTLEPISEKNKLPHGMSKKNKGDATKQGAQRVDPDDHEEILEEIDRRTNLEHEETWDESEDESDDEGEESASEGEGDDGYEHQ